MRDQGIVKDTERPHYRALIMESASLILRSSWVLWIVLFSGVMGAAFKIVQPLTQIYMQETNVPIALFGVASAYFFFAAAIASRGADWFERWFRKYSYAAMSLLFVVPLFLVSRINAVYSFLLFGLCFAAMSVSSTIVEHEILKATPSGKHATILSFNNLFYRALFAIVSPVFGYGMGILSLRTALFILAASLAAIFFVLVVAHFRIKRVGVV
jgi:hypothetical protein